MAGFAVITEALCADGSACWRHMVVPTLERHTGRVGRLAAKPAVIISNDRDSAVLEFGRSHGVPSVWIGDPAYEDHALHDEAICTQLSTHHVNVVLLPWI